ncbi:MAG TPA: DEAD/DEAH box helicase [Alphaproteobacteria bacterium]|nr:DEAD/DEAH box helicase [Alphaproteobacteria bacterium]
MKTIKNFESFKLPTEVLASLKSIKFNEPTEIQAQTIPHAIEGKDVLATAQTGTGKTAAFGIPVATFLINNPEKSVLILSPTRELAVQIHDTMRLFLKNTPSVLTALLIGGDPMGKQIKALEGNARFVRHKKEQLNFPRLIVGTPGRVNDHLLRQTLHLHTTELLVLDEVDRMLDMGFVVQLDKIATFLPKVRQTLMFSATLSKEVNRIAQNYLTDPVRVNVGSVTSPTENVTQEVVKLKEEEKYDVLLQKLAEVKSSAIIFVKTKYGTEKLAKRLCGSGIEACAIHGDLRQRSRDRLISQFRLEKFNVLVATDIAARGLDIPHIECVINFDLPPCPEDYIHRIGRTGRAGAKGHALSFITSQDFIKWRNILKLINPQEELKMERERPARSAKKPFKSHSKGGPKGAPFQKAAPKKKSAWKNKA